MVLRKLNDLGVDRFREFLTEARSGNQQPNVPEILLTLPRTSEEVPGMPKLERFSHHPSNYELARYLTHCFSGIDTAIIEGNDGLGDPGFWAAVALYYFHLISPGYRDENDSPKADNRYIPQRDMILGRYYRHSLAGPYRLYKLKGVLSEPLLLGPVGQHSAIYQKITDSVFYTETKCVCEAINLLYFDAGARKLKRGWNATDKSGCLPRLLSVIDQLDLTYDLLAIDGEALLSLLPREFEQWQPIN